MLDQLEEPIASSVIQTPINLDPPFIKFPPFPEPPPGVTIMPFKQFKPRGIQLFSELKKSGDGEEGGEEEDAELDALGIPTVELRVKHATDERKSNSRKKRKKKKGPIGMTVEAVPIKKLQWFDEWEEGEDLRVTRVRYEPSLSPVDRFFQSAYDFRTGRPWPPVSIGLNTLWDQFRMFTGLLINPSVYRKTGAKKFIRADSPDEISDDEEDLPMSADADEARPAKRQRSNGLDEENEDALFHDPQKLDEEVREEKISIFLADPEKAVRVFLSSFMREQGLIWTYPNLIYAPRLLSFFLAFVVRNRVLPEPSYQRGLKRALETIEKAKKELPQTNHVGKAIPDAFNEACRECFGRQGGMNWSTVNGNVIEEHKDASITVIDNGVTTNVALPTEAQTQLKDAIEDNVDVDMNMNMNTVSTTLSPTNEDANASGWPNESGDGWGSGWGSGESWAQTGWAQGDDEGQQGEGDDDAKWLDANPTWNRDAASLFGHLGPSVFPLTHTTGIVECSTRRVGAVRFPPGHPMGIVSSSADSESPEKRTGGEWTPSASGVEAELEARFAQVTLEPWGREEGDISRPEIWTTSRGPVIDPSKRSNAATNDGASRRPHDPLTDSITLLVDPTFGELLAQAPGFGLGAMWIEIARQKDGDEGQVDESTPGRFWYHEDVTGIFPSFYTPREKEYR